MSGFDPARLASLDASLTDDSEVFELDDEELCRIAALDARRKCASLKLGARIVGMATAMGGELEDTDVLRSMTHVLQRLATLRKVGLAVVGVDKSSPDFPAVFNAVTNAMLDVVTAEWKWSMLTRNQSQPLPTSVIATLLEFAIRIQPERFDPLIAGVNLATARRLCVLESVPKLYNLVNYFDYYQAKPDAMINRLLQSVVEQAEFHTSLLSSTDSPAFAVQAILQRMYSVSVGIMCEVYKSSAYRDVARLRGMSELDRSVVIAQYEHLGGMKYSHIIDEHRVAMDRIQDTANLVTESRRKA